MLLPLSHSTQRCLLHQPGQYQPVSAHLLKKSKLSSSSPRKTDKEGVSWLTETHRHVLKCSTTTAAVWSVFTVLSQGARASQVGSHPHSTLSNKGCSTKISIPFPLQSGAESALGKGAWSGLSTRDFTNQ